MSQEKTKYPIGIEPETLYFRREDARLIREMQKTLAPKANDETEEGSKRS